MKAWSFEVPLYEITVTLVQVESPDDADSVKGCCEDIGLMPEDIAAIMEHITLDHKNGGDTFRNFEKGKMLVIFYRMEDRKWQRKIYNHEKRHVEDRILQWCGVNDIEAAAYLAGFVGEQFYELYSKML